MASVDVLSYVGPGASKDEKIAVGQELWRPHLAHPGRIIFRPTRRDMQPINAALDLTILAGFEVETDPALLQPLVASCVGTVTISCTKRSAETAIRGRERALHFSKAIVSSDRVRPYLLRALYEIDYWEMEPSLQAKYNHTCPPDGSPPHERYAREMDTLLSGGVAAFNSILTRRAPPDADRFSILFERAIERGWIEFD